MAENNRCASGEVDYETGYIHEWGWSLCCAGKWGIMTLVTVRAPAVSGYS